MVDPRRLRRGGRRSTRPARSRDRTTDRIVPRTACPWTADRWAAGCPATACRRLGGPGGTGLRRAGRCSSGPARAEPHPAARTSCGRPTVSRGDGGQLLVAPPTIVRQRRSSCSDRCRNRSPAGPAGSSPRSGARSARAVADRGCTADGHPGQRSRQYGRSGHGQRGGPSRRDGHGQPADPCGRDGHRRRGGLSGRDGHRKRADPCGRDGHRRRGGLSGQDGHHRRGGPYGQDGHHRRDDRYAARDQKTDGPYGPVGHHRPGGRYEQDGHHRRDGPSEQDGHRKPAGRNGAGDQRMDDRYGQDGHHRRDGPSEQDGHHRPDDPSEQDGHHQQDDPSEQDGHHQQDDPYGTDGHHRTDDPYGTDGHHRTDGPYGPADHPHGRDETSADLTRQAHDQQLRPFLGSIRKSSVVLDSPGRFLPALVDRRRAHCLVLAYRWSGRQFGRRPNAGLGSHPLRTDSRFRAACHCAARFAAPADRRLPGSSW